MMKAIVGTGLVMALAAVLPALAEGVADKPAESAGTSPGTPAPQPAETNPTNFPPAAPQSPSAGPAAERRPAMPRLPEIADPTRISESFRQALERRVPAKNLPGNAAAKAAPVSKLPQISLVASVCGRSKEMMHAMLRINGKVELVRPGEKLTVIDNNGVIQIEVLDIQRSHVHVRVISDSLNQELMLH